MESGQHLKLPKSELEQMKADLQRQARIERLKITIQVKDNGDGTVDISWTVSAGTVPAISPTGSGNGEQKPAAASPESKRDMPTAPTRGSKAAASFGGPSGTGGLLEKSEAVDRERAAIKSGGKVPNQAVEIVIGFEGFVDHVYDDGVGVATIGYGTTSYPDGRRVRFGDPKINKETAAVYLSHDIEGTVKKLNSSIPHWNEMDDNRRSALISFAYNLGENFYGGGGFKTITASLRDKRWGDVPKAMELYCNPNDPKVHQGLLRRRKAEGELWQGKGPFAK